MKKPRRLAGRPISGQPEDERSAAGNETRPVTPAGGERLLEETPEDLESFLRAAFPKAADAPTGWCADASPNPAVDEPNGRNDSADTPAFTGGTRYELRGEIGRGGMGVVLKGRDTEIGRDVAVKVLRELHAADPEMVRRFLEEARITGRLQHPGIVPVYEFGLGRDARPFFAMKLVEGHTLATLLRQRVDPAQDRVRFLAIFEQVCQTIAYAHARGVIHRDLKPANVMVGLFGEVQVMDWGLAKELPRGKGAPGTDAGSVAEPSDDPVRFADSPESGAGSVKGTPGYMSPEQARGEACRLDERCDVFTLGAMLCEILTGAPAHVGGTPEEARRAAASSRLDEAIARLASSDADEDLIRIARNCLAADPEDRPCDAGEVACSIAAHRASLEERARAAEIGAAEARAREEQAEDKAKAERKARRFGVWLAVAVSLMVCTGSVFYLWWEMDRRTRAEEATRAVSEALEEVHALQAEAKASPLDSLPKWAQALSTAKRVRALARSSLVDSDVRRRADEMFGRLQ